MKFSSEKFFSRGKVSLIVVAVEGIILPKVRFFFLDSLASMIDKIFDPSPIQVNASCHSYIDIVHDAIHHLCRNSPDFVFDIFFC